MRSRYITHRCIDDMLAPGEFSGGERVRCNGVRYNNGNLEDGCGEPCSWMMGKSSHGKPPWQTTPDGYRTDPGEPDSTAEAPDANIV